MRQQALVLTIRILPLLRMKSGSFFTKFENLFTADQLKKIRCTEGWIGGLILLSESLSRYSEDVRTKFISEELLDHFKKEVFEYFGREFFSYQPEHVQKFLVKTSVFDPIEPSFMKNLVGMENAEEILQGFAERNLFVQSIYREEKGWSFRFHQLFRNFLKAKFESELEDEERRSLLLEAARLYAHRNELENAVRYFLQVKAYGELYL
jgi:ATP/maltotriose-dependent transcriptional regulator MalT